MIPRQSTWRTVLVFNLLQGSLIVVAAKLLSMQDPGNKIAYFSQFGRWGKPCEIRSWALWWLSSKWIRNPVYSWNSPKALKSHASTCDERRHKEKRKTISSERKKTRCGMFFSRKTDKPNMFKDAMWYIRIICWWKAIIVQKPEWREFLRFCLRISTIGDDFTTTIWDMLCQVSCVLLIIVYILSTRSQCEGSHETRASQ